MLMQLRHLYNNKLDETTICGLTAFNAAAGSRLKGDLTVSVVHFSKARKTDCEKCRKKHREQIHETRAAAKRAFLLPQQNVG